MKIFFTASVSNGQKYRTQYQLIINTLEKLGHTVLSREVAFDKVTPNGKRLSVDKNHSSRQIIERERNKIDNSNFVVAEVTQPSFGVGMLISYALQKGKIVLALLYRESDNTISPFIEGNPSQHLFYEHYSEDIITTVLKRFFRHLETNNKRQGKLIVIDGSDSSGKKTQVDLLLGYLRKNNYQSKYIDFPRYYSSFHGKTVARYLAGEFGTMDQINPYLASLAYAMDRLAAKDDLDQWLLEKNIVVANRYVPSSMAFQTARVPDNEKKEFLNWLYDMEYKEHKLPLEDVVVYLYVPVEISQKLMEKRENKKYLQKQKKDLHEQNIKFLYEVEKMYLTLAKNNNHWIKINCLNNSKMLRTIEDIHSEIINQLKKRKILT